jgi:hypothetical protein
MHVYTENFFSQKKISKKKSTEKKSVMADEKLV